MRIVSDDEITKMAAALGPRSASARAMDELARRRAKGEDAVCILDVVLGMIRVSPNRFQAGA